MAKEWVKPAYWCKVDTERGKEAQQRNIHRSKEMLRPNVVLLHGDNFEFISFEDITEIKLWERRDARSA